MIRSSRQHLSTKSNGGSEASNKIANCGMIRSSSRQHLSTKSNEGSEASNKIANKKELAT